MYSKISITLVIYLASIDYSVIMTSALAVFPSPNSSLDIYD